VSSPFIKKIIILGTTGSGKTTFLKHLIGESDEEFDGAEVPRNVKIEEGLEFNTFNPIEYQDYKDSTTTISMNVKSVLFLITRTNQFQYFPLKKNLPIPIEEIESVYPTTVIDLPGQERLSFMQEVVLPGTDAAFIFADGSNIASIERISHYVNLIKEEQQKKNKKIPITIFVNKKDLIHRGIYIGSAAVLRWIDGTDIQIDETSNFQPETFLIPIRNMLDSLPGFPISSEQLMKIPPKKAEQKS